MITKLLLGGSFNFDEPVVSLVPLHRGGVDDHWLRKHASTHGVFHEKLAELKPMKDHTIIHVLAVGDKEGFGYNRNGDGMSEADNKRCHSRFQTEGHVYKNHANKDPLKKTGEVVATAHNDPMRRIELLAALENSKNGPELDKLARGEDLPVSMGTWQDYDVCSWCKHQAKTAKEHCEHIKHNLGDVREDGVVCGMDNPDPHYFDLSTVFRPADRIGFTLRKVAADGGRVIGGHELAEDIGLTAPGSLKVAMLIRLAEIEKRVEGVGKAICGAPRRLTDDAKKLLKRACALDGTDAVLATLHRRGFLLSPVDFAEVLLGHQKAAAAAAAIEAGQTGGFARQLKSGVDCTSLDGDILKIARLDDSLEAALNSECSMRPDAVQHRAICAAIEGKHLQKTAAHGLDDIEAQGLADLYVQYRLAFANAANQYGDPRVVDAVATISRW